jgi:hypothetical protein
MGDPSDCTPLSQECRALLERVRARCPELLPKDPLPPGTPAKPVAIGRQEADAVVGVALRQAAAIDATGRLPATDRALPDVVVWEDGESTLAVELVKVSTETADGRITFAVPVRCDQLPELRGTVRVTFAVGTPRRPTGLLAATPRHPDGPEIVVRRWGDALAALAWRALLDAAAGIAGAAGADTDGTPLIVAALTATGNGVEILPQARQPFDRVPTGRAVRPR